MNIIQAASHPSTALHNYLHEKVTNFDVIQMNYTYDDVSSFRMPTWSSLKMRTGYLF